MGDAAESFALALDLTEQRVLCINVVVDDMQTWRRICEASRNEFDAIYQRLDVHILWRGESFYNPVLKSLVEELIERGIAEDSDGAQVTRQAS